MDWWLARPTNPSVSIWRVGNETQQSTIHLTNQTIKENYLKQALWAKFAKKLFLTICHFHANSFCYMILQNVNLNQITLMETRLLWSTVTCGTAASYLNTANSLPCIQLLLSNLTLGKICIIPLTAVYNDPFNVNLDAHLPKAVTHFYVSLRSKVANWVWVSHQQKVNPYML